MVPLQVAVIVVSLIYNVVLYTTVILIHMEGGVGEGGMRGGGGGGGEGGGGEEGRRGRHISPSRKPLSHSISWYLSTLPSLLPHLTLLPHRL